MWVNHLSLTNFRNYEQAEFVFKPGANLLLGRNGQGKTNAIEAIAYFASLHSHRVAQDSGLIRAGAESGVARMSTHRLDRDVLLEIQLNTEGPKKAQLNRSPIKPSEISQYFSCVMFAPEDLQIVRGDPAARRRFLDEALVAKNPGLRSLLADYERVVKQRTALLKSARSLGLSRKDTSTQALSTLEVWNERLIELGTRIMREREILVYELTAPLAGAYRVLVDDDHAPKLSLNETAAQQTYEPQGSVPRETSDIAQDFRSALDSIAAEERERAMTLVGPHRDDLVLTLNNLPVKGFASHGETWTFVLSLRLSMAELLRNESRAGDPVLILDDVFAELDSRRRERLFAAVSGFDQIIVTAAVAADVAENVQWNTIHVAAGQVVASGHNGDTQ